jgi:hypothetical protein
VVNRTWLTGEPSPPLVTRSRRPTETPRSWRWGSGGRRACRRCSSSGPPDATAGTRPLRPDRRAGERGPRSVPCLLVFLSISSLRLHDARVMHPRVNTQTTSVTNIWAPVSLPDGRGGPHGPAMAPLDLCAMRADSGQQRRAGGLSDQEEGPMGLHRISDAGLLGLGPAPGPGPPRCCRHWPSC